jgi:2'-5' RNA ligase
MAKHKTVVIDEIHVTVRVPGDLPEDAAEVVRRALAGDEFMSRLRRAVRAVVRVFPELNSIRVSLTR